MEFSTSSCGWPFASRYTFSRQLLSLAPRFVKTAITSCVSTRTSRSAASETSGDAAGAVASGPDGAFEGVDGGGASDVGDAVAGVAAPGVAAPAEDAGTFWLVAGFGTGFTKSACQMYSTRKARPIARRTRRC